MKYPALFVIVLLTGMNLSGQVADPGKIRIAGGIGGPELIHLGLSYRLADFSQLGIYGGGGPSWGTAWYALSLEHRLYFGVASERSGRQSWFFRQGVTYFPGAVQPQRLSLNLTAGKDLVFLSGRAGMTFDAGIFYLAGSENSSVILVRSLNLWPAIRIQFFLDF